MSNIRNTILASCLRAFVVTAVPLLFSGCAVLVKLGIQSPPDLEQRRGPAGTAASPVVLNPFDPVRLVMAADECRTFRVRVPGGWYLKYLITVVNRRDGKPAFLKAGFQVFDPSWAEMAPHPLTKRFFIREGSSQAVLAVANRGKDRDVLLELCQEGPPMEVILQPETSKVVDTFIVPRPAFGKDGEIPPP